MTDEPATLTDPKDGAEPTSWDEDNDPDGYTLDDISPKDWFLDVTLNFALGMNDEFVGGSVGITVESGGVVVSGLAISRAEWIDETVKLYAEAGAEETGSYVEQLYRKAHDDTLAQASRRRENGLPPLARRSLHMKQVRLGVGGQTTQVPLWRGKLDEVTGWSLGSWNPNQESA